MAGIGPTDLYDLADEYLTACHAALELTAAGAPARYYVSPGPPVFDCPEQLTVHAGGSVVADTFPLQPSLSPGHRVQAYGQVNIVPLTATIIRCTPTIDDNGNLPTPAELDAVSRTICADLWGIWQYVKNKVHDGTLFATTHSAREFFFDPAVPLVQQGMASGWQITVRVQLDGYSIF